MTSFSMLTWLGMYLNIRALYKSVLTRGKRKTQEVGDIIYYYLKSTWLNYRYFIYNKISQCYAMECGVTWFFLILYKIIRPISRFGWGTLGFSFWTYDKQYNYAASIQKLPCFYAACKVGYLQPLICIRILSRYSYFTDHFFTVLIFLNELSTMEFGFIESYYASTY